MQIFIKAIDLNIWEAMEIGPYISTTVERTTIDGSTTSGSTGTGNELTNKEEQRVQIVEKPKRKVTRPAYLDD